MDLEYNHDEDDDIYDDEDHDDDDDVDDDDVDDDDDDYYYYYYYYYYFENENNTWENGHDLHIGNSDREAGTWRSINTMENTNLRWNSFRIRNLWNEIIIDGMNIGASDAGGQVELGLN